MVPNINTHKTEYIQWRESLKPLPVGTVLMYDDKIYKVIAVRPNKSVVGNRIADAIVDLARSTKGGAVLKVPGISAPVVHIARDLANGKASIISQPGDRQSSLRPDQVN